MISNAGCTVNVSIKGREKIATNKQKVEPETRTSEGYFVDKE